MTHTICIAIGPKKHYLAGARIRTWIQQVPGKVDGLLELRLHPPDIPHPDLIPLPVFLCFERSSNALLDSSVDILRVRDRGESVGSTEELKKHCREEHSL